MKNPANAKVRISFIHVSTVNSVRRNPKTRPIPSELIYLKLVSGNLLLVFLFPSCLDQVSNDLRIFFI